MNARMKFWGESNFTLANKVAKSFDRNCKLKGFNVWISITTTRAGFIFPVSEKEMEPGSLVLEKDSGVLGRYFVAIRGSGDFPFSDLNKKDLGEVNVGKATCSFWDISFDGESGLDAVFDADSVNISIGQHDQPLVKPTRVAKVVPMLIIRAASNFTVAKKLQKSFDKDFRAKGVSVWISIATTHDSHSFPIGPSEIRSGDIKIKRDLDVPGRYGLEIDCVAEVPLTSLKELDFDDIKAGKAKCTFRAVAYEDTYMLDAAFDTESEAIALSVKE